MPDDADRTERAAAVEDGARTRRIVVLAPFPPRHDGVHGGSRAIAGLVAALAERHRVALAFLRAHDEPGIDDGLARHCDIVLEERRGGSLQSSVRPLTPGFLATLVPRLLAGLPLWVAGRYSAAFHRRVQVLVETWRPDVVQAEYSVMGQYLAPAWRQASPQVVTFHEPAAAATAERGLPGGLAARLWRAEARRWRRYEAGLLGRIDAAVAFTPRDAAVLRALTARAGVASAASVDVIPLGVRVPVAARQPDAAPAGAPEAAPNDAPTAARRLVFIGNFAHPPNGDAARFLAGEIFPPLRRRFADLELWIVGAGAPAGLASPDAPGVVVTGLVPDADAHLAEATIVVAPLRQGGGMRVKVLEAMAAGKAIVATALAVEGIAAHDRRELLVADDAQSFRVAISDLLDDPARRAELGRAARACVMEHHSPSGTARAYESLHARLIGERSPAPPPPQAPHA